jgi:hypothetical protein
MAQNIFQQIQAIIEDSRLDDIQKREFGEVFARTKEDALAPVLEIFQEDPGWVEKLYKNYKEKKEAIVTGNLDAWREVIATEKRELEQTK